MQKPLIILELEERAKQLNIPTDILDDLQAEKGYVELTLSAGGKVFGKPDCITWGGDDGLDKELRFIPYYSLHNKAVYYRVEDISSYMPCAEDDIPPCE